VGPTTSVKVALAVVVISLATFSTARARQQWIESDAHANFTHAQMRVDKLLAHADAVGLLPAELAPYRSTARRLGDGTLPASSLLWNPAGAPFFEARARSYRKLGANLRREMKRVRDSAREETAAALNTLAQRLKRAAGLDLQIRSGQHAFDKLSSSFRSSRTPREFRSLTAILSRSTAVLEASIEPEQAYVNHLFASTGGELTAVFRFADAEARRWQPRLDLLALLSSKGRQDKDALAGLMSGIHAQKTAFNAAVMESHLSEAAHGIITDLKSGIPSKMIVVSTERQTASAYAGGMELYTTPVTTGGPELPTDHGVFHIYLKLSPFTFHSPWPIGSPYYYPPTPITYWMPFYKAEGLHDASWRSNFGPGSNLAPTNLGTGVSILGTHGCVNLPSAAAAFIWNWAPVGTTVVVV
jgi:L,D-transpeptidase catalytic domain